MDLPPHSRCHVFLFLSGKAGLEELELKCVSRQISQPESGSQTVLDILTMVLQA